MPPAKLKFRRSAAFRRAFEGLTSQQQKTAREVFAIFRRNIFDPSLDNHIIQQLSSRYRTTVRAVWIERNLRATYCQKGDTVVALDIGTHDIYR